MLNTLIWELQKFGFNKNKSNVTIGGRGSKIANRIGKRISEEVNFVEYWQRALGKYSPNLWRGWTTIVDKDTEDSYLTSESQKSGVIGAQRNSREEKGDLALNKEEKKKEKKSSRSLRIECTATT